MKNFQIFFTIYKKNLIENIISKYKSDKFHNSQNNGNFNKDFVNITNLFQWAKKLGGFFDKFHIKYLDTNNRYIVGSENIQVIQIKKIIFTERRFNRILSRKFNFLKIY